ncbi:tyrosine-protein kinase Drl isoform X1 [Lutzomyia longipalpis]|uniref:tyrosine-protein kinase Drl isoform X1 n=1 Tax=Lutzomyia longipalpis TaxID=7200 RepID=UPI0024845C29|nr:tyrosine-protein kinase Drl isoform X1 [Lutzomyia longipalpis]XP_055686406.1 tyrosine-protein kinase Drl isoform X1 [Lutzomyia longipalpis]XP_055686407.1 tyrosine-protein kinase Drl isoform X1 [Lutzomyia longipalpis]XP_055686408.1 tyrosine-protein kinase Drl isoform X1 [Lutzomyia longipalpis]XP_055686409.1 tyrosine-protein kinase Drl isoform X1 [Lutzomyia longipalpis]
MCNLTLIVGGVLLLWFTPFISCYLNVFINQKEMKKLMGLDAELFYVHEGVVNTYAMLFVVPVPANVNDLEFSWQSLVEHPLSYTITIDYATELEALMPPELSIPTRGFVPRVLDTFTVHLPCSGKESEEIPIAINLHIRAPSRRNDTRLNFKRNKICLKGLNSVSPSPAKAPSQTSALLGAVACALGLVLVIGLIASAMYIRARKQIRQDSLHTSFTTAAYGSNQNVFIRLDAVGRPASINSDSYATITSLNKFPLAESKRSWLGKPSSPSPYATALLALPPSQDVAETIYSKPESLCPSRVSYYASSQLTQICSLSTPRSFHSNVFDPKDKLRRVAVPQGTIQCRDVVQEGTYGRIYSGLLQNALTGEAHEVLVKTVVDGASLTQVAFLLTEGSILMGISHPNLQSPVAACMELPGPPQIAYPWPLNGNLKLYLQNSRENSNPPSTRQLVEFGLQVTRGLAHLHTIGILHRDVATRNCVIDAEMNVKICDSGLSRDLFPDDYHCLGDNENRPVRWLALETLQKKLFVISSDVWSLGVLLWELTTLAAMPYEEVDPFELEAYLRDGYRLSQPVNCPDEFYTVMSCCWLQDHAQRPSFPQLIAYLHDFHADLEKYI